MGPTSAADRRGGRRGRARRPAGDPGQVVGDLPGFLTAYYRLVAVEDLIAAGPGRLAADGGAGTPRSAPAARRAARPSASARSTDASLTGAGTVIDIVTDDMPYLVDSVTMELNRHAADIRLIVHPLLTVHRDVAGRGARDRRAAGDRRRRGPRVLDPRRARPGRRPASGSPPTCAASSMTCGSRWRTSGACGRPPATSSSCSTDEGGPEEAEASELLAWLSAGHFTFLGYRKYDLVRR